MGEHSAIEWCDHTFNPWEGCQKVGPGCDHCYAETRNARFGGGTAPNWGPGALRRRTSAANWRKPLAWDRDAAAKGIRYRVFCASLADVFDNAVDPAWRADLFTLIGATPHLDWLLLTKRIGNVANMLPVPFDFERLYPNVWLGATIVNQAEADRDIPKLLATTARIRFLSMEPLLGPVDLTRVAPGQRLAGAVSYEHVIHALKGGRWDQLMRVGDEDGPKLNWIIVGGESGPGARPMHPDWARSLRDQCAAAGVPFLFKQWGEWKAGSQRVARMGTVAFDLGAPQYLVWPDGTITTSGSADDHGGPAAWLKRIGKHAAGRLLDGVQHDGRPA